MPSIMRNESWQLKLVTLATTQVGINLRLYRSISESVAPVDAQVTADQMGAIFAPLYKAILSEAAEYRGLSIRRIWPLPVTLETISIVGQGPGTVAGDILPRQVSGLAKFVTAQAGRKFRGRTFFAFPGETDSDAQGRPSAGYITRMSALATALTNVFVLPQAEGPMDFAPILNGLVAGVFTWPRIIGFVARERWANQRRRGDLSPTNLAPF